MLQVAMLDGQGVNLWEVVLHSGMVARVVLRSWRCSRW